MSPVPPFRSIRATLLEQFFFCDQLLRITQQDQEHVKRLRLDGQGFAGFDQGKLAFAQCPAVAGWFRAFISPPA
jgi:hypothetical protein